MWLPGQGSISQKIDENKRLRHEGVSVSRNHLCVCMIHVCVCMNHLIPDYIWLHSGISDLCRALWEYTYIVWRHSPLRFEELRSLKCSESVSISFPISYHPHKTRVLSGWLLYNEGRIPQVPTPNSSLKTCRCPLEGEEVIRVSADHLLYGQLTQGW